MTSNQENVDPKWSKKLSQHEQRKRREQRAASRAAEADRLAAEMRDQVIGVLHSSKLSWERVEAEGGPVASTLKSWSEGRTRRPRVDTMRSALRVVGYDLAIVQFRKN